MGIPGMGAVQSPSAENSADALAEASAVPQQALGGIASQESGSAGAPASGFELHDTAARRALQADLGDRAAHSAAWRAGGSVAGAIVRLGVLAVLARRLPPSAFGVVAMSAVVTGFASTVTELGLSSAIVQRPRLASAQLWGIFRLTLGISLALWGCCAVVSPLVGRFFHEPQAGPVLLVSAAMLPITALAAVPWGLLARYLEFKKIAICELADVVVNGAVSVSMALLGMGVWSLVGGTLAGLAVSTLLLLVFSPWRPTPSRGAIEWGALVRFGTAVAAMSLAFYWTDRVVNLLVGRLLGSMALGLYVVAFNLAIGVAGQVSAVTRVVAFPAFSAIQHDPSRLAAAYKRCVRWSAALAFPFCALMAVLAPQFVSFFLGAQWAACVLPFRLLLAVGAMRSLYGFSGLVLRSVGRPQTELAIQTVFAGGVAVASFIGARGGIGGVAAGGALFVCLLGGPLFITMAARASRVGLLSVLRCASGPAFAAAAAAAIASVGGRAGAVMWPQAPALAALAVGGMVGLLTYVVALRLVAGDLFVEARSRLPEALRAGGLGRILGGSTAPEPRLQSRESKTRAT